MINFYEGAIGAFLVLALPILVELLSTLAKLTSNSPNSNIIKLANASQLSVVLKNIRKREPVAVEAFCFYLILGSFNIYAFSLLYRIFTSKMTPMGIKHFFSFCAVYAFVSLIVIALVDLYSNKRINFSEFLDRLTFSMSVLMLSFIGFGLKLTQTNFSVVDALFFLSFQAVLYLNFSKSYLSNEKLATFQLRMISTLRMGLNMCAFTLYFISSGVNLRPEHFILTIFGVLIVELFMKNFAFESLKLGRSFKKKKLEKAFMIALSFILTLKVVL
ncbi:MAG: hypothetical protein KC478_02505 [Bacteriovoracaceae bacterium]|nr:hypothetical protein [Bacteriovoracaceae bacterium]